MKNGLCATDEHANAQASPFDLEALEPKANKRNNRYTEPTGRAAAQQARLKIYGVTIAWKFRKVPLVRVVFNCGRAGPGQGFGGGAITPWQCVHCVIDRRNTSVIKPFCTQTS